MNLPEKNKELAWNKKTVNDGCLKMLHELKERKTQKEIAVELKIQPSTISEVLSGKRYFPKGKISKLINLYKN